MLEHGKRVLDLVHSGGVPGESAGDAFGEFAQAADRVMRATKEEIRDALKDLIEIFDNPDPRSRKNTNE